MLHYPKLPEYEQLSPSYLRKLHLVPAQLQLSEGHRGVGEAGKAPECTAGASGGERAWWMASTARKAGIGTSLWHARESGGIIIFCILSAA